jgi:hypothetical protein
MQDGYDGLQATYTAEVNWSCLPARRKLCYSFRRRVTPITVSPSC